MILTVVPLDKDGTIAPCTTVTCTLAVDDFWVIVLYAVKVNVYAVPTVREKGLAMKLSLCFASETMSRTSALFA